MNIKITLLAVIALAITGCTATGGKVVQLSYEPSLQIAGGSGDLYLSRPKRPAGQAPWVVGEMRNNIWEKIGDVVTELPPEDLLMKAYEAELKKAGYNVIVSEGVTPNTAKAIEFSLLDMNLMQRTSILKLDARSTIKASAIIWRDGKQVTTSDFEATFADATAGNRDVFLQYTLAEATKDLMEKSVPDMMKVLGDQPKRLSEEKVTPAIPSPAPAPDKTGSSANSPSNPMLLKAPEGYYIVWQRSGAAQVTAYEIHRAEGNSSFTLLATVKGNIYVYNDKTATPGKEYRYKIRAVANSDFTPFSDEVFDKGAK